MPSRQARRTLRRIFPSDVCSRASWATGGRRTYRLRNRIVHEYGRLDLQRVYEAARDDLGDLESFAAAVAGAYRL